MFVSATWNWPGFMPSVEVSALPLDMGLNERLIVCLVKMSLGKLDSVRNVLDIECLATDDHNAILNDLS